MTRFPLRRILTFDNISQYSPGQIPSFTECRCRNGTQMVASSGNPRPIDKHPASYVLASPRDQARFTSGPSLPTNDTSRHGRPQGALCNQPLKHRSDTDQTHTFRPQGVDLPDICSLNIPSWISWPSLPLVAVFYHLGFRSEPIRISLGNLISYRIAPRVSIPYPMSGSAQPHA